MIDGRGINCVMVRMFPRPFAIMPAFPAMINPIARRIEQTWIGSKFALSTNTGSFISSQQLRNYTSSFDNL